MSDNFDLDDLPEIAFSETQPCSLNTYEYCENCLSDTSSTCSDENESLFYLAPLPPTPQLPLRLRRITSSDKHNIETHFKNSILERDTKKRIENLKIGGYRKFRMCVGIAYKKISK
jgi:hypothetical protein